MQVSCQTTVLSVFSVLFDVGFSRMHISHHHSFSWLLILEISCIHDVASTIQTVQLFKGNYLLSFLIKESIINSPLPSSSFLCLFHSSTLPSPPLPSSPFLSLSLLSALSLSLSLSALPSMHPSLYSPPLPHTQWVPHSYTTFYPHTPAKLTKQPCPEVVTHTHSFIHTDTHHHYNFSLQSYILPNQPISEKTPLHRFQVPVETIEKSSGLIFFDKVPRNSIKQARPVFDSWLC